MSRAADFIPVSELEEVRALVADAINGFDFFEISTPTLALDSAWEEDCWRSGSVFIKMKDSESPITHMVRLTWLNRNGELEVQFSPGDLDIDFDISDLPLRLYSELVSRLANHD